MKVGSELAGSGLGWFLISVNELSRGLIFPSEQTEKHAGLLTVNKDSLVFLHTASDTPLKLFLAYGRTAIGTQVQSDLATQFLSIPQRSQSFVGPVLWRLKHVTDINFRTSKTQTYK